MSFRPTRLFAGCRPEVAAGPDGRILAVGAAAREAAGADADVEELRGRTLPGLADAHIHLESLARLKLEVDLAGSPSLDHALARIRKCAATLPPDAWVMGRGWYNDVWPDARFPDRRSLDDAVAGRPALLLRKDGHSGWVSSAALAVAAITRETPNPPGGVIDRDPDGEASGIVRENAVQAVQRCIPRPSDEQLDAAMAATLRDLARRGLTSVHSMDTPVAFASLSVYGLAARCLSGSATTSPRGASSTPSTLASTAVWATTACASGASRHSWTARSAAGPPRWSTGPACQC